MDYISYPQIEDLLRKLPTLKALLNNLYIEFNKTLMLHDSNQESFTESEILYTCYIGNHIYSDMPHAMPTPGDKMINAIMKKDKMIEEGPGEGYKQILKYLMESINIVGEVVEKTTAALTCVTDIERTVIELRYFQDQQWKEVSEGAKVESPSKAGQIRKEALEKMLKVLRITWEQYDFCMDKMK
jgi:hypothetical protein